MDKKEIEALILKEVDKTKALIEEYREMSKPVAPDVAIGRISRMDAINNKSITEASLRQAEQKLHNLNRVSEKINSPEFGTCLKCKQSIPIGRIIIKPESLYCVNCAQ